MFLREAMAESLASAMDRMKSAPAGALERVVEGMPPARSFGAAIRRVGGPVRVIAEFKRSSPSAGQIRPGAQAASMAREYEESGAAAASIITSDRFDGRLSDLVEAGAACALPLLCKDFISDEYQLLEARASGASAVLLISDALEPDRLSALLAASRGLGLDALVESHAFKSLERALGSGADIIGINNRDLRTLEVDTHTTARLLPYVPAGTVVVSESGIRDGDCVKRMDELGVDALLIGEELMRAADPGSRLRELLEGTGTASPGTRPSGGGVACVGEDLWDKRAR